MKVKELTMTAIFAALTAVFAQIIIPLSFTPVPFSMGVFAVYLTGAILDKRHAVYAQLIYILLGAVGIPVFGGMRGGIGFFAGPSGGYILTYPLMAFLVACIAQVWKRKTVVSLAAGMLCAIAVCYIGGSLWYCAVAKVTWATSVKYTVLPFVPFDLIKIAACAPFGKALNTALGKAKLLPAQRVK